MVQLSDELRAKIEQGLRDWDKPGNEFRQRFEATHQKWVEALRPLTEAIEASERITERDLNIIVY